MPLFTSAARLVPRLALSALFAGIIAPVSAQLVVDLPDLELQPNMDNQQFSLQIQNTSGSAIPVTGLELYLQVADGGPEAGGSIDGPAISVIGLVGNTPFEPNHDEIPGNSVYPQLYQAQVITDSGTVDIPDGPSLFATVVFNTLGVAPGTYSFSLNPSLVPGGQMTYTTTGSPITPTLFEGQLTVVPEPSTYAAIAGIGCLAFAAWRKRAR